MPMFYGMVTTRCLLWLWFKAIPALHTATCKLSSNVLKGNDKLTITVTVTNTGKRDGKHTVELYSQGLIRQYCPLQ